MANAFYPYSSGSDPFGFSTLQRPWNEGGTPMDMAKKRLHAAFEFISKLGVSEL